MTRVSLSITLPDRVWLGQLSRAYSETRFRILALIPVDSHGAYLVDIITPTTLAVLSELPKCESLDDVRVLKQQEKEALVLLETSSTILLSALHEAALPVEPPISVIDGEAYLVIRGSQERLSKFTHQLVELDIPFTIQKVEQQVETGSPLTESQLYLIREALRRGFYDTPRKCSLTELAQELNKSKAAVSETLHRAEGKIIKQYVGEDFSIQQN